MVDKSHIIRMVLFWFVLAAFAFPFPASPTLAGENPDEIIAGIPKDFPPHYSIDEKTGKPYGFAIDTMDEIAKRAGLKKVRYVDKAIRGYDHVREGEYAVLTVSDSGSGIAAADLDKIFEPFYLINTRAGGS